MPAASKAKSHCGTCPSGAVCGAAGVAVATAARLPGSTGAVPATEPLQRPDEPPLGVDALRQRDDPLPPDDHAAGCEGSRTPANRTQGVAYPTP